MRRIKIALDPILKEKYGPEICWTWRQLLVGIGYFWEEVPLGSMDCDIAYVRKGSYSGPCRYLLQTDISWWDRLSECRLASVRAVDGWRLPCYEGEHLEGPLLQCVDGRILFNQDIVRDVYWLVTGQEEKCWPKDVHGHFRLEETPFYKQKVFHQALASGIGTCLGKALSNMVDLPIPIPRWPQGKKAVVCIGHDVDYPEVVRWLEPFRRLIRDGFCSPSSLFALAVGTRNHWHFKSWVQMEKAFGVRSAFYFVASKGSLLRYAFGTPDPFYDVKAERFRDVLRYLVEEGFEIGMHASYRACESKPKFQREKHLLEELSGQPINGNRHHYFRLNPQDPESTLLLHEQINLKYDTSLIHERYIGWRRGMSWPFFPFHEKKRRELKTLQISTAWMDDQLFGYSACNPGDRSGILKDLIDTMEEQGGCLLTDVHEYTFDEVLFPGWSMAYQTLLKNVRERSSIWIDTPGAVASHWMQRQDAIVKGSKGLAGD